MIISLLLIAIAALLFYNVIRLNSFALIIMALAPFQQMINIFYGYYFIDDFFNNNFIHNYLLKEGDIDFILFNYLIYLAAVWFFGLVISRIFRSAFPVLRAVPMDYFLFSVDKLVLVYSVVVLVFLLSVDLNNLLAKVMRLSFYYISFVPLLIGYYIRQLKLTTLLVFGSVVLFFVIINLLVGSRGYMAVIFVALTYGMLANKENRLVLRYYLATALVLYFLVFPFLGFIELFRAEYGRIAYEDVDQARIELLAREYQDKEKYEKSSESGFARNITWPNISVMLLTGSEVPAVGFSNIANDAAFIFTNTFISGKSVEDARQDYIDRLWGAGPANLYGYQVGLSNSVEFSLLADGIWRYGRFGFIYHVFIIVLIGISVESLLIRRINARGISLFILLLAGNLYLLFITVINGEPLISILRIMIYTGVFSMMLSYALKPLLAKTQT